MLIGVSWFNKMFMHTPAATAGHASSAWNATSPPWLAPCTTTGSEVRRAA